MNFIPAYYHSFIVDFFFEQNAFHSTKNRLQPPIRVNNKLNNCKISFIYFYKFSLFGQMTECDHISLILSLNVKNL